MAGKVHYGGDEALEARVDSLESGDAWTNKTTGYVPVVQGDGSIALLRQHEPNLRREISDG